MELQTPARTRSSNASRSDLKQEWVYQIDLFRIDCWIVPLNCSFSFSFFIFSPLKITWNIWRGISLFDLDVCWTTRPAFSRSTLSAVSACCTASEAAISWMPMVNPSATRRRALPKAKTPRQLLRRPQRQQLQPHRARYRSTRTFEAIASRCWLCSPSPVHSDRLLYSSCLNETLYSRRSTRSH